VVSCQLPVASCQLSVVSCESSVVKPAAGVMLGLWLLVAHFKCPVLCKSQLVPYTCQQELASDN
ncbi:MAG: hypothetical protein ABI882_18935, partial [Acidobacteriota bacterium]